MHMKNDRKRESNYGKPIHELNQGDIQFPMKTKVLPTFEQLNKL